MRTKIKDALKQRYNNLGLSEEAFDGVAASVETVITDENLDGFLKGAEPLLKQFQSIADAARSKKINELEAKIKTLEEHKTETPNPITLESISAKIAEAVSTAVKPLNEEILSLRASKKLQESIDVAKAKFFSGDYAKRYNVEAEEAWERVIELNEAGGNKFTTEELTAKAEGYFNKAVSKIGVDTSKPFTPEPDPNQIPDFSDDVKYLQQEGLLPKSDSK